MWDVSCGRGMCVPPTWPLCVWTVNHRWFTGVIQRLFTHKWKLSGNQNSLQVGTSHSWVQRLKCCEVNHQSVYDNFKKMGGMGGGGLQSRWAAPREDDEDGLEDYSRRGCIYYNSKPLRVCFIIWMASWEAIFAQLDTSFWVQIKQEKNIFPKRHTALPPWKQTPLNSS